MPARSSQPPDFAASQLFLRRLAFHLVRDEARAEDLVQETWATWVERRPKGLSEPRAWLARVLRNRAFNLKRADERRARHEELAGRPDPSAPETDGTLEAQAQLVEALRKLEEPYRSTLVQRYYHDLSPSAIAERAGTPLDTVKARLARGLQKLRAEMDRRYHGDRRAWSHWLTVLGAPPVPVGSPGAPGGPAPLVGSTSGGAILAWCGVAAVLVATGLRKSSRSEPRPPAPPPVAAQPQRSAQEPRSGRNEPAPAEPSAEPTTARESAGSTANLASPVVAQPPAPELDLRAAGPARDRFDWPQYGGGPAHADTRAREDEIHAPKVMWFVPGCAGQPTLDGDDLYTGGLTVARLDAATGMVDAAYEAWLMEALGLEQRLNELGYGGSATTRDPSEALRGFLEGFDPSDWAKHAAAGSPVVTSRFVFVRDARDGSVLALNHDLGEELWRWESGWDERVTDSPATRVPLCLTEEDVVLVPLNSVLVALRARDGRELWRYSVNGAIEMVPAADDGRVFFGTDRGLFVALSATTGKVLWRAGGEEFAPVAPVVVGGRVLAITGGSRRSFQPSSSPKLLTWDAHSGAALWEHRAYSSAGLGLLEKGREVAFSRLHGIDKVDLETAKDDFRTWIETESLAQGALVIVGKSIVFADQDGRVSVHDVEHGGALRWAFHLPQGVTVTDLVHSGRRLYVATSIGLFCLADDEERAAVEPGFVLAWKGDPRLPPYLVEEK
jgi:RNA polymerase sigma-70 factor (ECF subfamily)